MALHRTWRNPDYVMNTRILCTAGLALLIAGPSAHAQDQNAAAERARIANQRIQAEAERRAREEQAREQDRSRDATPAAEPISPAARATAPIAVPQPALAPEPATESGDGSPGPPIERPDRGADPTLTRTLEQLRTLGELRDAGYVTDDEFEQIKRRILDETL